MVTLNIFLISLSINFNEIYFLIENKTSDSQEEVKLCHSSIFTNGEVSTIDRNINFHARTVVPRTASFISNQRSNPSSVVERDYL